MTPIEPDPAVGAPSATKEGAGAAAGRRKPGLRASRLLQWAVTLTCVALLIALVDLRAMGRVLLSVRIPLYLASVGVAFMDRGVMAAKWFPLLRAQVPSVPFGRAVRAYFAAGLANLLIPTPVSGDVLRAVALGRGRGAVTLIGTSIVMERLLGMMASGILCLFALAVAVGSSVRLGHLVPWVVALITATFIVLLLPMNRAIASRVSAWAARRRPSRWFGVAERFLAAYSDYASRKRMLAAVGVLSFLEQLFPILCFWILNEALGTSPTLRMLIVAVPLSLFISRLPIAVSGIGVGEGTLVYFLGLFGVPAYEALALALAGTTLNVIVALPGLILWREVMRGEIGRTA